MQLNKMAIFRLLLRFKASYQAFPNKIKYKYIHIYVMYVYIIHIYINMYIVRKEFKTVVGATVNI